MKTILVRSVLFLYCLSMWPVIAEDMDVEMGVEYRFFPEDSLLADYNHASSFYVDAEYYTSWRDNTELLTINIFGRKDERDPDRTHADVREFSWIHVEDTWEVRTGIRKVFWGVTEGLHLVDIINQTDFVENIDGEDKLGQPMVNLSMVRDIGIFDFFVMPGFRERTFPGTDARLRVPVPINEDVVFYESSDGKDHVDVAARWTNYYGNWEWGVSWFRGTSRDPRFVSNITPSSFVFSSINGNQVPVGLVKGFEPELYPVYDLIEQKGLALLYIYEGWAIKGEVIKRSGECWSNKGTGYVNFCSDAYTRATGGFEYTQVGIFDTLMDLGWVVEGMYDDRGAESPESFEHDLLVANRYTFNDKDDTNILMGVFWDPKTHERSLTLEANRRFGSSIRASIEGRLFDQDKDPLPLDQFVLGMVNPDPDEKLRPFADEDFIQLDIAYYF